MWPRVLLAIGLVMPLPLSAVVNQSFQVSATITPGCLIVGGGANWLGHIAQEWHDVVDIPQDPHLAICRGVHLLLQSQRESILKQAHAALAKREATKETTE